ncbi:MAG: hypothetical protein JWM91_4814 [Rhodospirillales bacterium]|nr:hypothetical protein [Rhodospirillales bacterium]
MNHAVYCAAHAILKDEPLCLSRKTRDADVTAVDLDESQKWVQLYDLNVEGNHRFTYDTRISWTLNDDGHDEVGNCTVIAHWKYNQLLNVGWPIDGIWIGEAAVNSSKRNHAFVLVRGSVDGMVGLYVLSSGIDHPMPIQHILGVHGIGWTQVIEYTHADVFQAQELSISDSQ